MHSDIALCKSSHLSPVLSGEQELCEFGRV